MRTFLLAILTSGCLLAGCGSDAGEEDAGAAGVAGIYILDRARLEASRNEQSQLEIAYLEEKLKDAADDEGQDDRERLKELREGYEKDNAVRAASTRGEYVLRPDGTFTHSGSNPAGKVIATGSWEIDGERVTFRTSIVNGFPQNPPVVTVGIWSAEGISVRPIPQLPFPWYFERK